MIWKAFAAEFRRSWLNLRRYPSETISSLIVVVVVFYGLFLGASYMSGNSIFGNRLGDMIVSYSLWTMVLMSVGNMGWSIANEAQNGTLEQVLLSPLSPGVIMLLRNLAELLYTIGFTAATIVLILLVTGRRLTLSVLDFVPLLLAVGASIGLGYMIASMTLLLKRTQQLLNLVQFVLLFVIMTPFTTLPGMWRDAATVIPLAPMVGLLTQMTVYGTGIEAPGNWLLWSLVNMFLWLGAGYWIFARAFHKARSKGVLGHY